MIVDVHNLQLPFLCQLSKSAPNILWSVGSSLHNQFLQIGRGNPAVMVTKIYIFKKQRSYRRSRKMGTPLGPIHARSKRAVTGRFYLTIPTNIAATFLLPSTLK
jgi:hypothetical protein